MRIRQFCGCPSFAKGTPTRFPPQRRHPSALSALRYSGASLRSTSLGECTESGRDTNLVSLAQRGVTFNYRDHRCNGRAQYRTMTLTPDEFMRRFLLHVLPKGFHRIRHYGLLASGRCTANIARARQLIAVPVPSVDPLAQRDTADTAAAATDYCPPCHCAVAA